VERRSNLIRAGALVLVSGLLAVTWVQFSREAPSAPPAAPAPGSSAPTVAAVVPIRGPIAPYAAPAPSGNHAVLPQPHDGMARSEPVGASAGNPETAQRPATAGMVIGIDPETGRLGMPTPEQLRNLEAQQQIQIEHSPDLVEIHNPDGSVTVDLQGRFQEYATVRTGPDGKLIFECVDGAKNAERVLHSPTGDAPGATTAAPAPRAEER
jgi:hypothetical protein